MKISFLTSNLKNVEGMEPPCFLVIWKELFIRLAN